jgi:hypothetical protein
MLPVMCVGQKIQKGFYPPVAELVTRRELKSEMENCSVSIFPCLSDLGCILSCRSI